MQYAAQKWMKSLCMNEAQLWNKPDADMFLAR